MIHTGETLYGMQCVIAPTFKRQVKTSRCKLLNWIYKKVYGYVEEPYLECDMIHLPFVGQIVFKDKATFNRIKEMLKSEVAESE